MITDDGVLKLPADAIMDLWQQVRQAGFVAPDSFPCGLDEYARYIIPVMARLPYLSPVTVTSKHADISNSPTGLKITPRTCTVPRRWEGQLELMPV